MSAWFHVAPSIASAFLASAVEFIEALTVVLAVGVTRGWRPALLGAGAAALLLIGLVAVFGRELGLLPLAMVQLGVGILAALFGLRWLRKAVLRSTGFIALHDEAAAYDKEVQRLSGEDARRGCDIAGFVTAFKIVMIEGIEVVFIIIALGAGDSSLLIPAIVGAGAALMLVIAAGFVLHRPLARIPENSLKFVVGVLLSAFGTFWIGEGLGVPWPGSDLALAYLAAAYLGGALLAIAACRTPSASGWKEARP